MPWPQQRRILNPLSHNGNSSLAHFKIGFFIFLRFKSSSRIVDNSRLSEMTFADLSSQCVVQLSVDFWHLWPAKSHGEWGQLSQLCRHICLASELCCKFWTLTTWILSFQVNVTVDYIRPASPATETVPAFSERTCATVTIGGMWVLGRQRLGRS